MQPSSLELRNVIYYLNDVFPVQGYFVNNVHQLDADSFVLKFWHPDRPEAQLLISATRGMCLTKYQQPFRETSPFLLDLRNNITRTEVVSISQVDEERIVRMDLKRPEASLVLLAEFFGGGNILLLNPAGVVLALLRPVAVPARRLRKGEPYVPPVKGGLDFLGVSRQAFAAAAESELSIARWLGRTFSLPRKYVEEILLRASQDVRSDARNLTPADYDLIFERSREVQTLALNPRASGWIVLKDGEPLDAVPFPFVTLKERGLQECSSFMEAVDHVLTAEISHKRDEALLAPHRKRVLELEKSVEEQARLRAELAGQGEQVKRFASRLVEAAREGKYTLDSEVLRGLGAQVGSAPTGRTVVEVGNFAVEVPEAASVNSLASMFFNEAKRLERKISTIEAAERRLREKLDRYRKTLVPSVSEQPMVRRTKRWFERYRWFRTTQGLLAIGGRDSSSNSAIIRRHLQENDLVFHADFYGSPFFVLKDASAANDMSLRQVAQAVVGYSRAWSGGLSSADAYWIRPAQVRTVGPSQTYLRKGSFLITGKKNVIKDLPLRLGIGLATDQGRFFVLGGPEEAVKASSLAFVTIVPNGQEKASLASAIKSALTRLLPEHLQRDAKKLPLDEFVRALPSGRGRILRSSRAEQNR